MGFDVDKFEQTELVPRQKAISVPALSAFFDEEEKPEWVVCGLTASQIHKATSAEASRSVQAKILKAAAEFSGDPESILKELQDKEETPGEIAKRMEMLVAGSVAPKIELRVAVKLAKTFPIEFMHLTNEITGLTGMGFDMVKPEAASQETTSSS